MVNLVIKKLRQGNKISLHLSLVVYILLFQKHGIISGDCTFYF